MQQMGSVCGKVSNPRHVFPYSKAKEQPGQAAGMGHGSLRDPEDFVFMQRDGPDDPLILLALKKKKYNATKQSHGFHYDTSWNKNSSLGLFLCHSSPVRGCALA